jgi:hypothetical protein
MAMTEFPTEPLTGATVSDLMWLTGQWRGHRGDDVIEEAWGWPIGGTMMGMFRWVRADDTPFFYELTVLEPRDDTVVLRIKHFHPGLVGWEEKDRCVTFGLVAVTWPDPAGLGSAVFRQEDVADPPWMVYRATNLGLTSYFQRPGEVVRPQDVFHYTRALS